MPKVNFTIWVFPKWMAVKYTHDKHIFFENEIYKTQFILGLWSAMSRGSVNKSMWAYVCRWSSKDIGSWDPHLDGSGQAGLGILEYCG